MAAQQTSFRACCGTCGHWAPIKMNKGFSIYAPKGCEKSKSYSLISKLRHAYREPDIHGNALYTEVHCVDLWKEKLKIRAETGHKPIDIHKWLPQTPLALPKWIGFAPKPDSSLTPAEGSRTRQHLPLGAELHWASCSSTATIAAFWLCLAKINPFQHQLKAPLVQKSFCHFSGSKMGVGNNWKRMVNQQQMSNCAPTHYKTAYDYYPSEFFLKAPFWLVFYSHWWQHWTHYNFAGIK